MIIFFKME